MTCGPEFAGAVPRATFQLQSAARASAVAIIEIECDALDHWLTATGLQPLAVGRVRLCDLWGIDRGLLARWSPACLHLMPHGGRAILDELRAKLLAFGSLELSKAPAPFPEAVDEIERRMLQALARAASPRAVDLLLAQPDRWRRAGISGHTVPADTPRDAVLRRLLSPPLVAAWGRPNIGKSSLINALAQRDVAIVADMPGTTRDHVGVSLELDGLALRYIDTPGVPDPACSGTEFQPVQPAMSTTTPSNDLDTRALHLARVAVQSANIILHCGDALRPPPPLPETSTNQLVLRVALRTDLGRANWRHDLSVCTTTGEGLKELALRVRQCLVPDAALRDPAPWKFWD